MLRLVQLLSVLLSYSDSVFSAEHLFLATAFLLVTFPVLWPTSNHIFFCLQREFSGGVLSDVKLPMIWTPKQFASCFLSNRLSLWAFFRRWKELFPSLSPLLLLFLSPSILKAKSSCLFINIQAEGSYYKRTWNCICVLRLSCESDFWHLKDQKQW